MSGRLGWLESLNLSEPTTTEELKEVLLAVRDSDYNGNGSADEIALTGSPDWDCQLEWWLMSSFTPCDKTTLSYAKDGSEHMNSVIAALPPVEGPTGARYQFHNDYVDQSSSYS